MSEDKSYRFGAGRYIQEPDALNFAGDEIRRLGEKAYVIGGNTALSVAGKRLEKSLNHSGAEFCLEYYSGYPSDEKITSLKDAVLEEECDVLVGVGGGRIADLVKATADRLHIPVVIIPTQAATCAAFSPLSVLYTPEGKSSGYIHFQQEVNAVIVDEQVMLTQPVRLLSAGILDAMAKYVEIEMLSPYVLDEHTTIARHSAFHMAKYIYDVLWEKGPIAVKELSEGRWSKELHDVIYINIALTGIVSALMQGKGQTALAHAFNNMLHKQYLSYIKHYLHGELVAMGMIAQLVYNGKKESVSELRTYMKNMGMATTITEIGVPADQENLEHMVRCLSTYPFMTQDEKYEKRLREAIFEISKE